ncbi:MAG: tetratricopeptide repeat protein [Pseudomonadota bacterium]
MTGRFAQGRIALASMVAGGLALAVAAHPAMAQQTVYTQTVGKDDDVGVLIRELSGEPNYEELEMIVVVAKAPTVIGHEQIAKALEYVSEAAQHYDNGDPERAATMASLAIDSGILTRRDLAMVYRNRGVAQVALEDIDKAIADFSSAVTYRPDYAPAYSARAAALIRKGDFESARDDLDKALGLDPTLAAASYNRSLLKRRDGEDASAAYDLLKAHLSDPQNEVYRREAQALGLIHRPPSTE